MPRNQCLTHLADDCERSQTPNAARILTQIRNTNFVSYRVLTPTTLSRWLVLSLSLFCAIIFCQSVAQAQNVKYTNQAVDLGLRSDLKVDPATRAVELQIPLGNYPGRAGHDIPVTLSYSSKVWNMAFQGYNPGPPPGRGFGQPFTTIRAQYGEHSVAGWTTSIGSPLIDPSSR